MNTRLRVPRGLFAVILGVLGVVVSGCGAGDGGGDGGGGSGGGDDGVAGAQLGASEFCHSLSQIICQKGSDCDPNFPGTVQDCTDYMNNEYCIGISDYACPDEGRANSGACLQGVGALSCGEFMDNAHVAACDAMSECGSSGSGGSCDCSTVISDCTTTYDSNGNGHTTCSCSPSCCC